MHALRAPNRAPQESTPYEKGARKGKDYVSGARWTVDWRFHKPESRHVGWKYVCEVRPGKKVLILNQVECGHNVPRHP